MRPAFDPDRPVESVADLVGYFAASCTPRARWRVGTEHEKLALWRDTLASAPYDGPRGIAALLERLAAAGTWDVVRVPGGPIALTRGDQGVTLEPGGQVELSGAALPDVEAFARELEGHQAELRAAAADLGIVFLGLGYRPFETRDDLGWVPKPRYGVMGPYLAGRGRRGHDMMKMTATVQANFDFADEQDCVGKVRTAMGVTSLVTALLANSPLEGGRETGFLSWRAAAWRETDPDRCGLLPFVFEDDFGFRRYVEWALSVPMFFVKRGATFYPAGFPFGRFLAEGFQGERATVADWELHLTTLFPEVRLKHYLEVRGADAGSLALVRALPALWKGLLYDEAARADAWALVRDWTIPERLRLWAEVPALGPRTPLARGTVGDAARDLVGIAAEGLRRQRAAAGPDYPDEVGHLAPLHELADAGRCPADEVLELWRASGGDRRALVDRFAL